MFLVNAEEGETDCGSEENEGRGDRYRFLCLEMEKADEERYEDDAAADTTDGGDREE